MPNSVHPTPERIAAFHEAGHVVIAWLFWLEASCIELRDDSGSGRAKIPFSPNPLENAQIALAGATCQEAFLLACLHELAWMRDYGALREILEAEFPDDEDAREMARKGVEDDVTTLFTRPDVRVAVCTLAGRLLEARKPARAK